jgi:hypothetical protein
MFEAAEAKVPPPPELVPGEVLLWKMADVKGLITRHLVTGYLVTSYRCFIWDVAKNIVTVNVPIGLTDVMVDAKQMGKRAMRGGTFIVPKTADYVPPTMGEPVEVGNLVFRIESETAMVFRGVSEPVRLKSLIDALRTNVRVPSGLGVDVLWKSSADSARLGPRST